MSTFELLTNRGAEERDAKVLDAAFPDETGMLEGLEQVAEALSRVEGITMFPPQAEPWRSIYKEIIHTGDPDEGFQNALRQFDDALILAIGNLVANRVAELQQIAQQGKKRRFSTKEIIDQLSMWGYHFRLNLCGQDIEINGKRMNDFDIAEFRSRMREKGYPVGDALMDAVYVAARKNQYHPVREYLNGLKYDGGQHIRALAGYFSDKHGVFENWLRRWLIGACAKAFQRAFNPMLVLVGPQGLGKSRFAEWLASPLPNMFLDSQINPNDKDHSVRLLRFWIWEVGELGATTRKTDREALKAFISRRDVEVRKAYGRVETTGPALTSFIGTLNDEGGFLSDPTGNRRFLIAHLTQIDWKGYTQNVDVDQVWAEAYNAYLMGETWRLSAAEKQRAAKIAENYQMTNPVEEYLHNYFKIDPARTDWWTSTADILSTLENIGGLRGSTVQNSRLLSAAMTRLGLEVSRKRKGKQNLRGYYGVKMR